MRYLLFDAETPEVFWTDKITGKVLDKLTNSSLIETPRFNCIVDVQQKKISWNGIKWEDFEAGISYFKP